MMDWFTRLLEPGEHPTYIEWLEPAGVNYDVGYIKQQFADGEEYYMGWHPELDGCMTQVSHIGELTAMLKDARELFIESLTEDRLPVPKPGSHRTVTA